VSPHGEHCARNPLSAYETARFATVRRSPRHPRAASGQQESAHYGIRAASRRGCESRRCFWAGFVRSFRNPCCLAPWMRVETVLLGGLCPLITESVLPRAVGRSAIFGAGRRSLIGAGSARRRRPARTGCCHQPAAATSGMPAEEPAASHVPMFSRAKSWSRTIADAPITPARPPNEDRWISRSRVASGRERR
jgi:hypothetical protein